jgi:hypothetical protein
MQTETMEPGKAEVSKISPHKIVSKPKGRNEYGPYHSLTGWARPKDMYRKGGMVEANGRYHASSCGYTVNKS